MGSFWEYFLFYRLAGFYTAWLEGIYYPPVQDSFRFSLEFRRQFQYIYHANCCPETQICFFARSLASDHVSSHDDLCSQNWFPYSYFHWRKGCYFCFGQSFSLFLLPSPCQAIHSDYYMSLYPSLSIWSLSATSLGFHPDLNLLLWLRGINLYSLFLF